MRGWMQRGALAVAAVLALSACAADGGTEDSAGAEPTATTAAPGTSQTSPSTTAAPDTSQTSPSTSEAPEGDESPTSTTATSQPAPQVEGPAAPDFTLTLADGSTFTLSEEQKPVYLVFWAEW